MKKIERLKSNLHHSGYNRSTRIFAVILGVLTGLGGIFHGVFECLQGNEPARDILERIGAFTIIPNYLLTGLAAIFFGLLVIYWSIGCIHKKYGPLIYLLISISLFLTGGGIALIFGFLLTWGVATHINKPLTGWKKTLPEKLRKLLARFWLPFLISGFLLLSTGMAIWLIATPPGEIYQINIVDYICWSFLLTGLLFLLLTVISGFARDIGS
jgi:hypothetical protein